MRLSRLFVFSLGSMVLLLAVAACERQHRNYGGGEQSTPSGTPEYETTASVATIPTASHVAEVAPDAGKEAVIDGAALYAKACLACHQPTGAGVPAVFPPLDKSPYVTGDVERLASIIIYGLTGPVKVLGTTYQSAMAGLGPQYSDEELAAIATYIRTNWNNSASAVGAETFAAMRKKWGSRGPFTIAELGEEQ